MKKKYQYAIMQGRLLPRFNNRYQAFPLNYWKGEFHIAKEMGFDFVEFIFDYNDFQSNPLFSSSGIKEISKVVKESRVGVRSVCADYFMEAPLHVTDNKHSLKILKELITYCAKLEIKDIIIPCVDQSSLKNYQDIELFTKSLKQILPLAKDFSINLNLETDLGPKPFSELIRYLDSDIIKVNYDTGNSASLGYDMQEEFSMYGDKISILHIKDRVFQGGSVELGKGDTKFNLLQELLSKNSHINKITLQASRQLNYIEDMNGVKSQFNFIKKIIEENQE